MKRLTLLAALALVVMVVSGCTLFKADSSSDDIVSVSHTQSKAIPNFDSSKQTTTSATQIADFKAVLDEYSIGLNGEIGENCPGATTTTITSTLSDGSTHVLVVGGCTDDAGAKALEALVSGWRG